MVGGEEGDVAGRTTHRGAMAEADAELGVVDIGLADPLRPLLATVVDPLFRLE